MKRHVLSSCLLLSLSLLLPALLCGCAGEVSKEELCAIVLHDGNRADLRSTVSQVVESGGEKYDLYIDQIKTVYLCPLPDGVTVVDFSAGSAGGDSEHGFCFIGDDLPRGWLGEPLDGCEEGDGWRIESAGGVYYTERITRNWFYYRMEF